MNPRTNLEYTFEAKMTYIPNHTFEKLKGLLALTKKMQIQTFLKVLPRMEPRSTKTLKRTSKTLTLRKQRTHFENRFARMKNKIIRS